MTSCGGTFSVTVRRSTRTILSMMGISRKRPGPFGGECSRPSRKITPRSYSRAIRIDAESRNSKMTTTAATAMKAAVMRLLPDGRARLSYVTFRLVLGRSYGGLLGRPHLEDQTVFDPLDTDLFADPERLPRGPRPPELAVDEDEAVGVERPPHDADLAHKLFSTRRRDATARLHRLGHSEAEEDDERTRDRHGDLPGHLVGVAGRLEEKERAEDEARAAGQCERTVAHHERLGAEEERGKEQKQHTRPADR